MESLCTTAAGDGNGDGITGTELRALTILPQFYSVMLYGVVYGFGFSELRMIVRKSDAFLLSISGSFELQTRSLRFFGRDRAILIWSKLSTLCMASL
jgi:hypothetical protein